MAYETKAKTIKMDFIVCDRCKKEAPYHKTLSDSLELFVKHKWMPIVGTHDGVLCPECVNAIITEWYNKNKPDSLNEPLFNNKPDVYATLNVTNSSADKIAKEELNGFDVYDLGGEPSDEPVSANIWDNDDIPF